MASRQSIVIILLATASLNEVIIAEYNITVPEKCREETYCTEEAITADHYTDMNRVMKNITKLRNFKTEVWDTEMDTEPIGGQDDCPIVGGKGSYETIRYVRASKLQGEPWLPAAADESYAQRVYIERCANVNYSKPCFNNFAIPDKRKTVCEQQITAINLKLLIDGELVMRVHHIPTFCACKIQYVDDLNYELYDDTTLY